jgi:hypothetical protein
MSQTLPVADSRARVTGGLLGDPGCAQRGSQPQPRQLWLAACAQNRLFGAIPPFLLKTASNPEGVDGMVFADIKAAIDKDRNAHFEDYFNNFHNLDVLGGTRISDRA